VVQLFLKRPAVRLQILQNVPCIPTLATHCVKPSTFPQRGNYIVNQDRLWAPWRLEYVTGSPAPSLEAPLEPAAWQPGADRNCFLCRDAAVHDPAAAADRRLLIADRGRLTIVVLNRYPYNNGHLLVAPLRHVSDLGDMTPEEHVECMEQLARLTQIYRERLGAEGFNVGLNLGKPAGAGLPGHLHWHLVPRWSGDNNFMPVLAGIRVIPQSLDALWEMLTETLPPHDS
jgi:ATP adenylyltransferase